MFKYLVSVLLLVTQVAALHFYLEGDQQRCFYEELPKNTLVVGEYGTTSDTHDLAFLEFELHRMAFCVHAVLSPGLPEPPAGDTWHSSSA